MSVKRAEPVQFALDGMNGLVDDVLEVDEAAIRAAMAFCLTHFGLVLEAAGAAGIAALLAPMKIAPEHTVATVLCGGNTIDQGVAFATRRHGRECVSTGDLPCRRSGKR